MSIKFENTAIFGWEAAIRGMRNPMNSWDKSDSVFIDSEGDWYTLSGDIGPFSYVEEFTSDGEQAVIGPNDIDLMKRLCKAGTDHRKFMRMITVYVDITAPLYWWKEFETYKVGTVVNSCSTMHKITERELTIDDFSHEHLNTFSIRLLEDIVTRINANRQIYNSWSECYPESMDKKDYWWQIIQLLPSSYNQKRTVQLNYEVLSNIYNSRKNHKLDEWSIGFMNWIGSLPHSKLITGE